MLKNLGLAMVALSFLAIPAAADHGKKGLRNNNGPNEPHGQARAEAVQTANNKGDKDNNKSEGKKKREGWEKRAKHKAKGHS